MDTNKKTRRAESVVTLIPMIDNITAEYVTPNPLHRHVGWEMIFFINGKTQTTVNGKTIDCLSGDILLLGPMHLHDIKLLTTPHLHRDVYCPDSDLQKICAILGDNMYQKACSEENPIRLNIAPSTFSDLLPRLEGLSVLNSIKDSMAKKQAIANSIMQYVLGVYLEQTYIASNTIPYWIYHVLHEIQKHGYGHYSTDEIVALSNYSHAQFSKLFKRHMGVTLIEYLMDKRLETAAYYLRTSNEGILSISSIVGYDSLSYFIRLFKKKYGISPLQYRKACRESLETPNEKRTLSPL